MAAASFVFEAVITIPERMAKGNIDGVDVITIRDGLVVSKNSYMVKRRRIGGSTHSRPSYTASPILKICHGPWFSLKISSLSCDLDSEQAGGALSLFYHDVIGICRRLQSQRMLLINRRHVLGLLAARHFADHALPMLRPQRSEIARISQALTDEGRPAPSSATRPTIICSRQRQERSGQACCRLRPQDSEFTDRAGDQCGRPIPTGCLQWDGVVRSIEG